MGKAEGFCFFMDGFKNTETNRDVVQLQKKLTANLKAQKSDILIDYIICKMQIPVSRSISSQPSMFEAILEEFSMKEIEQEESSQQCYSPILNEPQEIFQEQNHQQPPHLWFLMDEAPFESILEQQELNTEETNLEFHRVKSLREEQQTKIAQFLRDDKYKSLRCIEIPQKHQSPQGKTSQSLSPRKTKRIDKTKTLRLLPESS